MLSFFFQTIVYVLNLQIIQSIKFKIKSQIKKKKVQKPFIYKLFSKFNNFFEHFNGFIEIVLYILCPKLCV